MQRVLSAGGAALGLTGALLGGAAVFLGRGAARETTEALTQANIGVDPRRLRIGQPLRLP